MSTFDGNKPATTDNYATGFVPALQGNAQSLAFMLDPTYVTAYSNLQTGMKRINGGVIQQWNGTAWAELVMAWAKLASPTFTGTPAAPTAAVDTNTTQLATTAFVLAQAASTNPVMNGAVAVGTSTRYARADHVHPSDTSRAPLASPALTGTPTAPTAAADTSTTQIASTAFVLGQAASAAPLMDGTAAVGTSKRYARQDHVHPSDTSRAPLASPALTGTPTVNGEPVGYLRVPRNAKTAAYTLTAADSGESIDTNSGVTAPSGVLGGGDAVVIYNNSAAAITITQGAGLTMRLAGTSTTGSRTLAAFGLASIYYRSGTECVVSGAGVS